MTDKRLITRLTDYWNSLRSSHNPLPQWVRFNAEEFRDIWQQCCGWRIDPGDGNSIIFTYDHVGDTVKEAIGNHLAGRKFVTSSRVLPGAPMTRNLVGANLAEQMFTSDFKGFKAASIVRKIDRLINNLVPIMDEGEFANEDGRKVRYRSCMLPFGNSEGKITRIVLGLSWKVC